MMRRVARLGVIGIGVVAAGYLAAVFAQTGFTRVILQDEALAVPGRHAVTARAEFEPGGEAGLHVHPGEEIGYVLEGQVELAIDGRPTASLKAGDVFFIPAGVPHNGRNAGGTKASILSVFVAEQGKALAVPVKR